MKKQLTAYLSVAAAFAGFLALWSLAAWLSHPGDALGEDGQLVMSDDGRPQPVGPVLLPGPAAVVADLYRMLFEQKYYLDVFDSVKRIVLGFVCSVVPATALGIWLGCAPRLRAAVTPVFAFIQYIPPVAFVPVLILWLGLGLGQQVAVLFIGTFFYLTIMIAVTVANTPEAYRDAALTLGVRPYQLVWKDIVPYGLPEFLQHLRVMMGISWTYLTVVEMVQAESGVGKVIIDSQRYLRTGPLLAGLLTIGALGILSDFLLLRASRLLCRWKY